VTTMHMRVRDFLILHYIANRREGEPLWDYLRHYADPRQLAHKLALFRARAPRPIYQSWPVRADSWLSVPARPGIMRTAMTVSPTDSISTWSPPSSTTLPADRKRGRGDAVARRIHRELLRSMNGAPRQIVICGA